MYLSLSLSLQDQTTQLIDAYSVARKADPCLLRENLADPNLADQIKYLTDWEYPDRPGY
jgi:hypothetical protein